MSSSNPQITPKEAIDSIVKHNEMVWNASAATLIEEALLNREGDLADNGSLTVETGLSTGRSPQDRYLVKDDITADKVHWGAHNQATTPEVFYRLLAKMKDYLKGKKLYARDAYACADKTYRMKLRVINTLAWHNLFAYNMFLRPSPHKLSDFKADFTILCVPEFTADPENDGTRSSNFVIVNFTEKMVIIGGTAYAGEMKKSIFSVLNFLLPTEKDVFPMHCSANVGPDHDTALFFGLSGTGKTTLSADPHRYLIGDDEHGWSEHSVFNFEGGCYAKVINLDEEKEPDIYRAIRFGAIVENTRFFTGTRNIDYTDSSVTENTRTSYPIHFIQNHLEPAVGGTPHHVFFLTCDAYGVLPPITRLDKAQAMYHFLAGYTAKVAGTEAGVKEPQATFSTCYGAPFMPLPPSTYARMLGERMEKHNVQVWLINTGWTGGPYGVGKRIDIRYTRAMIHAVLANKMDKVGYRQHSIFKISIPMHCPGVPSSVLSPRETWKNDRAYYAQANKLAMKFIANDEKMQWKLGSDILVGQPVPNNSYEVIYP